MSSRYFSTGSTRLKARPGPCLHSKNLLFSLDLPVKKADFQKEIYFLLVGFCKEITRMVYEEDIRINRAQDRMNSDYQEYAQEYLAGIKDQLHGAIKNNTSSSEQTNLVLNATSHRQRVKLEHPKAIICLDETKRLFDASYYSMYRDEGPTWMSLAFRRHSSSDCF